MVFHSPDRIPLHSRPVRRLRSRVARLGRTGVDAWALAFLLLLLATLAWTTPARPEQAAALLQILKRDFLLQFAAAGNAAFLLAQTLFYALLGLGMLLIVLHHSELRHMCQERLERVVSPVSAKTWAWAFLVVPFAAGFGLAIPTLLMLGLLWAVLPNRERALVVGLALITAAAPLAASVTGRATLPLESRSAPYYGVGSLENESPTLERQAQLAQASAANPRNGYLP